MTLGEALKSLGDNPFALCTVEPFCKTETVEFNGVSTENKIYNYAITEDGLLMDYFGMLRTYERE